MRLFEQSRHQSQQNMKFPEGSPNETQRAKQDYKNKAYGAQVMCTILFLAVLYIAARYEVMGVLRDVSRNDVVASPQTR
jgi:hypothetical protein